MQRTLPDIQKTADQRGIAIDEVGVSNIRYPMSFPLRDGGVFHTIATISMRVSLPHHQKGTHMSRFLIALQEKAMELRPENLQEILEHMLTLLEAETAFIDLTFPIFLSRPAPVTGLPGLMEYDCTLQGVLTSDGVLDKQVGVVVKAASLCPCSKEISRYGAHNQRSEITIKTRPLGMLWFEDLIEIAERNASCQLYPILKRPDEKHVTERAYENPKFVEDIVRDVSVDLSDLLKGGEVGWFFVSSRNEESIHKHDAYAHIERGERGTLLSSFQHG